ncbi:MAG TPA: hypothetical protein PLB01_08575 [Thermoanaerobaculia bacterium]|nr:hypothetical protein [Thermoanaerobaculia bacterium]
MKTRHPFLASVLAAVLLLAVSPMPAPIYMNIPNGATLALRTKVEFKQAVLCDGSVRLEPGSYDVSFKSLGDGSVRTTISGNGKTGHATGKVMGHEVVVQGGLQPGAAASVQKIQPGASNAAAGQGSAQANTPPSFASMGFTPQSQVSLRQEGNKLDVIVNGQGSNQILIGLLLPAVQKVREAANKPH